MDGKNPNRVTVTGTKVHGMSPKTYQEILKHRLDIPVDFAGTPEQARRLLSDSLVATGVSISRSALDSAEKLRLFHCASAGIGHLPLEKIREEGIVVTNASGVHAPSVSEQVVGWMLIFARRLHEGWYRQQQREWRHYQATEINNSTATIVGLGNIGTAIDARLSNFNVDTIGVRYTPKKGGPTNEVIGFETESFHEALSKTDYLILSSPLTETTQGLISDKAFEILPPSSVVINVGRGPIVDTDALVSAIKTNQIKGAALDVTDPEPLPKEHDLWKFKNVLITPHMAGHTEHYWERTGDILVSNINSIKKTGEYTDLDNQVIPE